MREEINEIRTEELADRLGIPKRRVYDVIAILKATNLVSTNRDRNGTTVSWIAGRTENQKKWVFNSNKLKVKTSGTFTSVMNRGTEVILESTESYITIEDI